MGEIVTHKKFGKQFRADFYHKDIPADAESLQAFLMTLPNIKAQRSKDIIKRFGVEGTIAILNGDIEQLLEINGITPQRLAPIKKAWDDTKYMRDLYNWLVKYKIDLGLAALMYKKWGMNTMEILEDDPYRMTELRGIGFIKADAYAHRMPKTISSESRTKACINYVLHEALTKKSDLCVVYSTLKKSVAKVIYECDENIGKKTDLEVYSQLVPKILKSNKIDFAVVKNLESKIVFVYLREIWEKELFVAGSLYGRNSFPKIDKGYDDFILAAAEQDMSNRAGRVIALDPCQKNAISSVFNNKVTIITGGGGTGKSTICRGIFFIAQKLGMSIKMMSPTGKAAQVLTDKTGCAATTIHRGLEMVMGEDLPKKSISEDILLVDEISMAGLDTMYALMAALEENPRAHIVFVGDKNQLPSVSAGNFLSDIMASNLANVVTLDRIHRQDEGSYISLLADEISKGRVAMIPEEANDIKWHKLHAEDFDSQILAFIEVYLKTNEMSDLQIISPMKKGNCGVFKINEVLQKKMATINNTETLYIERGFTRFHVGDRIIQTENNYDKNVFNGDMGVITDIGEEVRDANVSDQVNKYVEVNYYGQFVKYYDDEIDQIMLAWAITIHKFQGSQSRDILLVLANEAQIMMSKELVYTAFTRAEKMLDIFGHEQMLRMAPSKSVIRQRFTNMITIVKGLRDGKVVLEVLGS